MTRTGMGTIIALGLLFGGCASDDQRAEESAITQTMDAKGHVAWRGEIAINGDENKAVLKALKSAITRAGFSAEGFEMSRRVQDERGNTHLTLAQRIGGLEVEGAGVTVSFDKTRVYAVQGRVFAQAGVAKVPTFDRSVAISRALGKVGASTDDLNDKPTVSAIYRLVDGALAPALRVDFATDMTRPRVYLNPTTFAVLSHHDRMHHAATEGAGHTLGTHEHEGLEVPLDLYYDGSYYYQRDTSRNGGESTFRTVTTYDVDQCGSGSSLCGGEARNSENTWPKAHNNSAHYLTGQVLDFWTEHYGLDSYNNRGGNIRVFQLQDSNYDNAYWNGVDSIVIGDGSFNGDGGYYDYLGRLDVIAHEMGHAVEGGVGPDLLYQSESGALSEATADMSAVYFEMWFEAADGHADSNGDWLIGEDAIQAGSNYPYRAMRNMANPKEMGDPDTWGGQFYMPTEGCVPSASNDNCGVHSNSGVGNYAFYLQAEGGEGVNDHGIAYDVEGMGIEKAHAIMFQAVRYHMTNGSDYQAYYDALMTSAGELYGEGSDEQSCVQDSLNAVGLRVCGNNSCEIGEDFDLCPSDCAEDEAPEEPVEDDSPTPTPEVEAFEAMVDDIDFVQTRESRLNYNVYATISLKGLSENGTETVASGSWVQLSISDEAGNTKVLEGTTDYNGEFTVVEYKVRRGSQIEVCVLDATHPAYPYAPELNTETCATHTVSR